MRSKSIDGVFIITFNQNEMVVEQIKGKKPTFKHLANAIFYDCFATMVGVPNDKMWKVNVSTEKGKYTFYVPYAHSEGEVLLYISEQMQI